MVDEYAQPKSLYFPYIAVQIPLWSMNTFIEWVLYLCQRGSDSSMVDEYHVGATRSRLRCVVQIPLWSMNTRRELVLAAGRYVQIPLWSMNTILTSIPLLLLALFRFLYGR